MKNEISSTKPCTYNPNVMCVQFVKRACSEGCIKREEVEYSTTTKQKVKTEINY